MNRSRLSPADVDLSIKLGILLLNNGMTSKGVEKVLQVQHQASPSDLTAAIAIGAILQEIKMDFDSALYRYKQTNVFESPSLWNNIALCFGLRKKYVAAVSCLKRAIYLNPFDWRINYNLGLLNLQLRQFASGFHFLKNAAANCPSGGPNIFSLLGVCLENLQDQMNARQAHVTSAKNYAKTQGRNPLPLLNYAIFLYNTDNTQYRDVVIELLMEFEQCWLKRKQNSDDFDESLMKAATKLANLLSISNHMAWVKKTEIQNQQQLEQPQEQQLEQQLEQVNKSSNANENQTDV